MIKCRDFGLIGIRLVHPEGMIIDCEECGKQGTLDEDLYSGKTLKLRCPYCFRDFLYTVSGNGSGGITSLTPSSPEPSSGVELQLESSQEQDASNALILEAKRIARLIVSEIKLYNHEKIEKASGKREVLELLKPDLLRGKQHYNSRIASKLPLGPDYFMETVKEILLADKN